MATLLSEGFEGGALPAGWATSSPTGKANTWAVGSSIGGTGGPTSAYEGSYVLATNPSGNYARDEESVVDVELPDLTSYTGAVLTWAQWLWVVSANDTGAQIHLSTDGGATFAGVDGAHISPTYTDLAPSGAGVLLGTVGRWAGSGSSWVVTTLDLDAALGAAPRHQVVVRFAFEGRDNPTTRAGWYLDAVTLTADPVDVTPPEVAITSGDEATATPFEITGTASDDLTGVALVEVRVAGGDWEPATGTAVWTYSADLEEGENSIEVRATDGADNVSVIVTQTVTLDSVAPVVTITSPTVSETAAYTVRGTAADAVSGVSMVEVRVNGGDWTEAIGTTDWALDVTLVDGLNAVEARATDGYGNTSAAVSQAVTVSEPAIVGALAATLDWEPADDDAWLADAPVLEVAVLSSLWTWARDPDGDEPDDGDRQGWWADALQLGGVSHGSRLWRLARAKSSTETVARAREYAAEALAWMADEGLVERVDVVAERHPGGRIGLTITLHRPGDTAAVVRYGDLWAALAAAEAG